MCQHWVSLSPSLRHHPTYNTLPLQNSYTYNHPNLTSFNTQIQMDIPPRTTHLHYKTAAHTVNLTSIVFSTQYTYPHTTHLHYKTATHTVNLTSIVFSTQYRYSSHT